MMKQNSGTVGTSAVVKPKRKVVIQAWAKNVRFLSGSMDHAHRFSRRFDRLCLEYRPVAILVLARFTQTPPAKLFCGPKSNKTCNTFSNR
jgi:hypothetical protein